MSRDSPPPFEIVILMFSEELKQVWKKDLALKDNSPKSVTYYLNGPLLHIMNELKHIKQPGRNQLKLTKQILGLSFDINRQICDFKAAVSNCDITAEETTPKPLFNTQEPICPTGELACADGTWYVFFQVLDFSLSLFLLIHIKFITVCVGWLPSIVSIVMLISHKVQTYGPNRLKQWFATFFTTVYPQFVILLSI